MVLCCPAGKVEQIFYKRNIAKYNLTVLSCNKLERCYLWNETLTKRGACEIASCLWLWFQNLPSYVNRITLYSHSCSGQNLNVFVALMMLTGVKLSSIQEINHTFLIQEINYTFLIQEINHTFLESGHTQMEVHSMHSTIEALAKGTNVYVPRDWVIVIETAKKTK